MNIREATPDDIEHIIPLAVLMHHETRYCLARFDVDKTVDFLLSSIQDDEFLVIVAENDEGEIVGGFVGFASALYFSHDLYASDLGLYVAPDRRGGHAAVKLISHYVGWAMQKKVPPDFIQLGITTGVMLEETGQFFELLGFRKMGALYVYSGGYN
jgi:GNAT superfamily N-acetyltransferase